MAESNPLWSRLREWWDRAGLLDNLLLKVGALLVAMLLWFYLSIEEKTIVELEVPLKLEGLSRDLLITEGKIDRVKVELRAGASVLKTLSPLQIDARADLSQLRAGEQVIPLDSSIVRRPPFGVEVERIEPAQMVLIVRKRARRLIEVEPVWEGNPPPGYELQSSTVLPEAVWVEGEEERVRAATVSTEPIALLGRTEPFRERVRMIVRPQGAYLEGTSEATVNGRVGEVSAEKVLSGVEVEVRGGDRALRAVPPAVRLLVRGPRSRIEGIRAQDVRGFVDVSTLQGTPPFRIAPRFEIAEPGRFAGVIVRSVIPAEVDVVTGTRAPRRTEGSP